MFFEAISAAQKSEEKPWNFAHRLYIHVIKHPFYTMYVSTRKITFYSIWRSLVRNRQFYKFL